MTSCSWGRPGCPPARYPQIGPELTGARRCSRARNAIAPEVDPHRPISRSREQPVERRVAPDSFPLQRRDANRASPRLTDEESAPVWRASVVKAISSVVAEIVIGAPAARARNQRASQQQWIEKRGGRKHRAESGTGFRQETMRPQITKASCREAELVFGKAMRPNQIVEAARFDPAACPSAPKNPQARESTARHQSPPRPDQRGDVRNISLSASPVSRSCR